MQVDKWLETLPAGTLDEWDLFELADGPYGDRRVEQIVAIGFACVLAALSGSSEDDENKTIERIQDNLKALLSINEPEIKTEEERKEEELARMVRDVKLQQAKAQFR